MQTSFRDTWNALTSQLKVYLECNTDELSLNLIQEIARRHDSYSMLILLTFDTRVELKWNVENMWRKNEWEALCDNDDTPIMKNYDYKDSHWLVLLILHDIFGER